MKCPNCNSENTTLYDNDEVVWLSDDDGKVLEYWYCGDCIWHWLTESNVEVTKRILCKMTRVRK